MAEPVDMIVPLLREMRADFTERLEQMRAENAERHADIVARLDKLEEARQAFRHALSADTLMARLLTGEFEERIEALEKKVKELEAQK